MKYRDAARKLELLGCQSLPRKGGGSHRKWFNPETQQGTVLPDWAAKISNSAPCAQQFDNSALIGIPSTIFKESQFHQIVTFIIPKI